MAWSVPRTWVNTEIVTQTEMNTDVRDNMRELWHEVAYVEFTADVSSGAGTELAPTDIVSSGAITYPANPVVIEFWCSDFTNGTKINLWDGATDLGRWCFPNAALDSSVPMHLMRRLTPTAASHTYKARIWAGTVRAGVGGAGVALPGFIRVMQKGGT